MAVEQKRPVREIKLTDNSWVTIEDNNGRLTSGPLKKAMEHAFPYLEAQAKAWVETVSQYAPESVKKFIKEKESSKTPYRAILKGIPDTLYKPVNGLAEIDIKGKGTVTYKDNSEQIKTCTWKEYLTEISPALEKEAEELLLQSVRPERRDKKAEELKKWKVKNLSLREMWLQRLRNKRDLPSPDERRKIPKITSREQLEQVLREET